MSSLKGKYDISSYEDLQKARILLKENIREQEKAINDHPIIKIADAFKNKESIKDSLFNNLPELKFESGEKIISAFLLTNKATRKYYSGYLIAKEMIPFLFEKIKSVINTKEKSLEKDTKTPS